MTLPPDGSARRRCGECTACCTSLGVKFSAREYKPPGVRCGLVCSRGCRIYDSRPDPCREFACVWLQGGLPKHMRPDRVGMVFSVTPDGQTLVGFWDPARPALWRKAGVDAFLLDVSRRGAASIVGPAGGKALHRFVDGVELDRPPEADDYGPALAVGEDEAGLWCVWNEAGVRLALFPSEGEAHAWAAERLAPGAAESDPSSTHGGPL